jgi:hypothetical protein
MKLTAEKEILPSALKPRCPRLEGEAMRLRHQRPAIKQLAARKTQSGNKRQEHWHIKMLLL